MDLFLFAECNHLSVGSSGTKRFSRRQVRFLLRGRRSVHMYCIRGFLLRDFEWHRGSGYIPAFRCRYQFGTDKYDLYLWRTWDWRGSRGLRQRSGGDGVVIPGLEHVQLHSFQLDPAGHRYLYRRAHHLGCDGRRYDRIVEQ